MQGVVYLTSNYFVYMAVLSNALNNNNNGGKVNKCLKGFGLENDFRNFSLKKK